MEIKITHDNRILGVSFHLLVETAEDHEAIKMIQDKAGINLSGQLEVLEPTNALTWEIKLSVSEVKE